MTMWKGLREKNSVIRGYLKGLCGKLYKERTLWDYGKRFMWKGICGKNYGERTLWKGLSAISNLIFSADNI